MAHCLIIAARQKIYRELVKAVTDHGHECITCETPDEARAIFTVWKPDLALIDTCLPSEHGVALCWDLHLEHEDTPIIVIDSEPGLWHQDDILDCGAKQVLQLPLQRDVLAEIFESAFATN